MSVRILQGDCRDVLKTLPDESVHCVVSSPPYWRQRRYLPEGAVVLRRDLTDRERAYVETELRKAGVP